MRRPAEANKIYLCTTYKGEDNGEVCLCSVRESQNNASDTAEKRNEALGLMLSAEFRAAIGGRRASWLPRAVHGKLPPADVLI